jgi:hypothetical protein
MLIISQKGFVVQGRCETGDSSPNKWGLIPNHNGQSSSGKQNKCIIGLVTSNPHPIDQVSF